MRTIRIFITGFVTARILQELVKATIRSIPDAHRRYIRRLEIEAAHEEALYEDLQQHPVRSPFGATR